MPVNFILESCKVVRWLDLAQTKARSGSDGSHAAEGKGRLKRLGDATSIHARIAQAAGGHG